MRVMARVLLVLFLSVVSCQDTKSETAECGNSIIEKDEFCELGDETSCEDLGFLEGASALCSECNSWDISPCGCDDGYEKSDDGCVDIDECSEDESMCGGTEAGTCENIPGDYQCNCNDGYFSVDNNHSCSDSKYDFEGPDYSGDVILVVNTSTDGDSFEFSGTLPESATTILKSIVTDVNPMDMPFRISPVIPLPKDMKKKILQPLSNPVKTEYAKEVGDKESFFTYDFPTQKYSLEEGTLVHFGKFCEIFTTDTDIITAEVAQRIADEFDNKIYPIIDTEYAPVPDMNGDGKVTLFFIDTNGNAGGYYSPIDLFNADGSNKREIIFIDYTYGIEDETDFDVLVHELQHLVHNYQNLIVERARIDQFTYSWIDEGLATSAEHAYVGPRTWIEYYSYFTETYAEGRSLLHWDYYGNEVVADYVLSYLFFQYLRIQVEQNTSEEETPALFNEIIFDTKNDHRSVEKIVQKYIDPDMSFADFMTSFRVAMLTKENEGLYGFGKEQAFDVIDPPFYTGTGIKLRGGGAVYIKTDGNFKEPEDKGEHIKYVGITTK